MTTNRDNLNLYLVADGEATEATPATEWDGENSVLVAATTPDAAVSLACEYDGGLLDFENLQWDGQTLACLYKCTRDGEFF